MNNFFPNQRYTSEGEPELGVGIVSEVRLGRVQIQFPNADATRLYAIDNAPLRRVLFKIGDRIVDVEGRPLVIEHIQDNGELILYIGKEGVLSEGELGNVEVSQGVEDKLLSGEVDPPAWFALRRKCLEYEHKRRISHVNGLLGGRIDLIPHQLYIAHEVSTRYAPRVLLSDEVGLGKTIEACLILHRLLLSGRISRVLILVPESLLHQWFVELLRKFNLWFNIFDEERCQALEEGAPEGNPFLDDQLVLCSTDFLAGSMKRAQQAIIAGWDMLVVDEAHHLAWSTEEASTAYQIVDMLSRAAQGLLLLTATPEQLGQESHFGRLRLLDPDRYPDFEAFQEEPQEHQAVADLVEKLSKNEKLNPAESSLLEILVGENKQASLGQDQIIEDLLDQHGPGRVIFRNTRTAMQGFPKRLVHLNPIEAIGRIERLSAEFAEDLEVGSNPPIELMGDPRVQWLQTLLKKLSPEKILLICRTKAKVLSLEKLLKEDSSLKVGVFHEDLSIVQRDRNAAFFADRNGARILLCSEIGSEGRNFQFVHHLVLFDVPFNPELLEQRIGRLDRIGQTEDIHIHVPFVKGSPQEALTRWLHEGLNAFEDNLEGGNQLIQQFGKDLQEICLNISSPDAPQKLNEFIATTSTFQQKLKLRLAKGRDRLLEMNSFRPKVAEGLIQQIQEEDQEKSLENFMTEVFEQFGIEMEDLAPRTYFLEPVRKTIDAFPDLPDEGVSITFDRGRALSREDMRFLSWDHPMVTGGIDMVLSGGIGNASFGFLRGGRTGILLEAIFVLEIVGGQQLHVDRFLPQTPIRIVVDHTGEGVEAEFPPSLFNQHLFPAPIDRLLENETLVETILPNMIDQATALAEGIAAEKISQSLQNMQHRLDHEIDRLKTLAKRNNHIRREEIQFAEEEQQQLSNLIQEARIRLDGLLVVQQMGT